MGAHTYVDAFCLFTHPLIQDNNRYVFPRSLRLTSSFRTLQEDDLEKFYPYVYLTTHSIKLIHHCQ